jgi:hypothetical protein
VVSQTAAKTALSARLALVLAGSSLPSSEIERLQGAVRHQLAGLVAKAGVGQRIRIGPLVSAILADDRIVDATLRLADSAPGGHAGAPGEDFVPAQDTSVFLDESAIAFDAVAFDVPTDGAAIPVDVRFAATIALSPATPIAEAQAQIEARLRTYFATLSAPAPSAPGAKVSAESLLGVVRDEARYSVDRLTLRATFSAGEQFVTVAAGGPEFTVLPGHTFDVSEVSVTTPPAPGTPATS